MTSGVHIRNSPTNMSVSATLPNPAAFTAVGPGIVGKPSTLNPQP